MSSSWKEHGGGGRPLPEEGVSASRNREGGRRGWGGHGGPTARPPRALGQLGAPVCPRDEGARLWGSSREVHRGHQKHGRNGGLGPKGTLGIAQSRVDPETQDGKWGQVDLMGTVGAERAQHTLE